MHKTISLIGGLVIISLVAVFLLNYIFSADISGNGHGIFGVTQDIPTEEDSDSHQHETTSKTQVLTPPEVRFINTTFETGEPIPYKDIFQVKTESMTDFVNASTEQGFDFYLEKIEDDAGKEIFFKAWLESGIENDELSASLIFDADTESLVFLESGVYMFYVEVCTDEGAVSKMQVKIPIEVSR